MLMKRRDLLIGMAVTAVHSVPAAKAAPREQKMVFDVKYQRGPNGLSIFVPDRPKPSPAILLLHGSEGGQNGWTSVQAMTFASKGFVTLAFPYSKGGNPWHAGDILNVDLERTSDALTAIKNHEAVQGNKVGLYGVSRGAEHALLLVSLMARDGVQGLPEAVAVHAPSDTIAGAFISANWKPKDREVWDPSLRAWRWRGTTDGLTPTTPIEIEHYQGPLFISHGEEDDVWTVECTRRLEKRLISAGRKPEIHYYRGERHGFGPDARNIQNSRLAAFFQRTLDAK